MSYKVSNIYHNSHNFFTELRHFFAERKSKKKNYKELGVAYLEVLRLRNLPNNYNTTTEFGGKSIKINSPFWYLFGLQEMFFDKQYQFLSTTDTPYIIDCGANIGLSVIFFKKTYPLAKLLAIEADPDVFTMLEFNIKQFGYRDIELLNRAVWTNDSVLNFSCDNGVGGTIDRSTITSNTQISEIKGIRLKNLINKKVDFLKIDIESAEVEVLKDCSDVLHHVQHLFIEYHSPKDSSQELDQLLAILINNNFRYYIKEAWVTQKYPFTQKNILPAFDLQLNIFAMQKR